MEVSLKSFTGRPHTILRGCQLKFIAEKKRFKCRKNHFCHASKDDISLTGNSRRTRDEEKLAAKFAELKAQNWQEPLWDDLSDERQAELLGVESLSISWSNFKWVGATALVLLLFSDVILQDMAMWPTYLKEMWAIISTVVDKVFSMAYDFVDTFFLGKVSKFLATVLFLFKRLKVWNELLLTKIRFWDIAYSGLLVSFCSAVAGESIQDQQKLKLRWIGFPIAVSSLLTLALVVRKEKYILFVAAASFLNALVRRGGLMVAVTPIFLGFIPLFNDKLRALYFVLFYALLARILYQRQGWQKSETEVEGVNRLRIPAPFWFFRLVFAVWGFALAQKWGTHLHLVWSTI